MPALEQALIAAATRLEAPPLLQAHGRPSRRMPLRSLMLAAALLILVSGTAAAGTLLALRGSVIPGPAQRDLPPEQTPVPDTATIAPERAKDPVSGPPWALRIARSRTGFICSTVGQVAQDRFGIVGLDGKFRELAIGNVDGCGIERKNAASLVGARVFDAPRLADVRTVVNGIGGPELRRVFVDAGGRNREIHVGQQGVFIATFRGYPEDLGISVSLAFADGHIERHPFGASPFVTPDPAGGRAWRLEMSGMGQPLPAGCAGKDFRKKRCRPAPQKTRVSCAQFRPAREGLNLPFSELVCGRMAVTSSGRLRTNGYFFGVRREKPGKRRTSDPFEAGLWHKHPPRTAVFGGIGDDIKAIDVLGPGAPVHARLMINGGFLVMYGPTVLPSDLTVRVTFRDGRIETRRGDANLVPPGSTK
ncbi:MAG TPA: hypothetical protein VNT22_02415 [Baekduia sp.]|nr:hypothetical protein [Baekduia sp.]